MGFVAPYRWTGWALMQRLDTCWHTAVSDYLASSSPELRAALLKLIRWQSSCRKMVSRICRYPVHFMPAVPTIDGVEQYLLRS